MTAMNLLVAVILKTFCFMIGAFPIARNRTMTMKMVAIIVKDKAVRTCHNLFMCNGNFCCFVKE
jgi:hypothetical protein